MRAAIGPYQLVRRLGRGGMGEVWLGRSQMIGGLSKTVAVKLLTAGDGATLHAVLREARVALLLSHSNIVNVFDAGIDGDDGYLAMELVDGVDLGHLVAVYRAHAGSGVGVSIAAFVVREVLRALEHAHALAHEGRWLQLVHRDISPNNVMVSRAGEVKLTDFGIARSRLSATRVGKVSGKIRYMAPEQFAGKPLDARADLFAVGAVLHELLTGTPLRLGETPEQIIAQISAGPPGGLPFDVPPQLDALRRWLLEPDPTRRPASASDALAFLRSSGLDRDASGELAALCIAIIGRPASNTSITSTEGGIRDASTHTHGEDATVRSGDTRGGWSARPKPAPRVWPRWLKIGAGLVAVVAVVAGSVALKYGLGLLLNEGVVASYESPPHASVPPEPRQSQARPESQPERKPESQPELQPVDPPKLQAAPLVLVDPICPIDPDGDGVFDVVVLTGADGRHPTHISLLSGRDGSITKSVEWTRGRSRAWYCLANAFMHEEDKLVIWTASDLSHPVLELPNDSDEISFSHKHGCIRVANAPRGQPTAYEIERLTAIDDCPDPSHSLRPPSALTAGDDYFVANGTHDRILEIHRAHDGAEVWKRDVGVREYLPALALTPRHVWLFGGWDTPGPVGLMAFDRESGTTAFELETFDGLPQFLVADATQLLYANADSGVCSRALDDGRVRWCFTRK